MENRDGARAHFLLLLKSQVTRKEQAAALLETLLSKDNWAYISFYNALIRESYGDLAALLHADLPQLSPDGEKSYANGVSFSGTIHTTALFPHITLWYLTTGFLQHTDYTGSLLITPKRFLFPSPTFQHL